MLLSQGVPMLLHGDEMGRTQQGNNNAYCQDTELSWVDWSLAEEHKGLIEFTAGLTSLRKQHPVFRRRRFFAGKPIGKGDELRDIAWFTPAGEEMTEQNWDDAFGKAVVVFLNGEGIPDLDQRGMPVVDDSFLMAFNAHYEDIEMTLPGEDYGREWTVVVDTSTGEVAAEPGQQAAVAGGTLKVVARSLVVLRRAKQTEQAAQ
jgi:glycogen operon protein